MNEINDLSRAVVATIEATAKMLSTGVKAVLSGLKRALQRLTQPRSKKSQSGAVKPVRKNTLERFKLRYEDIPAPKLPKLSRKRKK